MTQCQLEPQREKIVWVAFSFYAQKHGLKMPWENGKSGRGMSTASIALQRRFSFSICHQTSTTADEGTKYKSISHVIDVFWEWKLVWIPLKKRHPLHRRKTRNLLTLDQTEWTPVRDSPNPISHLTTNWPLITYHIFDWPFMLALRCARKLQLQFGTEVVMVADVFVGARIWPFWKDPQDS